MPKATLKYDLSDPDDFIAHLRAIKSLDMALAIWNIVHNTKKNLHRTIGETDLSPDDVIDEVYKILEFTDGILLPENLNSSAIYNIQYHCRICIPIENTIIISYIKLISNDLIVAINGPLFIFIPKNSIDNNTWDIPEGFMNKKTNKKLQVGDYVKIQIMDKRINQGDSQIKIMGKLLDFATEDEVEKYYGSKIIKTENVDVVNTENDESNYII
jgi:DNA-directed RNA polymerase subunit E'/Rpb7